MLSTMRQLTNYKGIFKVLFAVACLLFLLIALLAIDETIRMESLGLRHLKSGSSIYESSTRNGNALQEVEGANVPFCSGSTLRGRDIERALQFSSQCSLERLTKLPLIVRVTGSSGDDSLGKHLSVMAENPIASQCACPRKLELSNFSIRRTALVSLPGSGNTWARHLIEQMTGMHSGSVYKFSALGNTNFPYEGVVNNVIVVKTHRPPKWNGLQIRHYRDGTSLTVRFDQLLFIIRNPYAAIMAEFKRSGLHLGKVGNALIDTNNTEWKRHFKLRSRNWGLLIQSTLNTSLPSQVIFYEDLKSCLLPQLVKMASFLYHEHLTEFSFCCTLKEREGSFHRPASSQEAEDVFSLQERKTMNQFIIDTSRAIKQTNKGVARKILTYIMA